MKIKLCVKEEETGKVLEDLGTCICDNPSRAVQMYNQEEKWQEKGYDCDIYWETVEETQYLANTIYETSPDWGSITEYADEPHMEKTVADLNEAGIEASFDECGEWGLVESGTLAIYEMSGVRKPKFGIFSASETREGFYELVAETGTLDEAREEIAEHNGSPYLMIEKHTKQPPCNDIQQRN